MTNSFHTRINDHALSFGMVRFATGQKDDDESLWKMVVSDYCGSTIFSRIEPSVKDFIAIKSFCDKAIDMLQTDGGRKEKA